MQRTIRSEQVQVQMQRREDSSVTVAETTMATVTLEEYAVSYTMAGRLFTAPVCYRVLCGDTSTTHATEAQAEAEYHRVLRHLARI